MALSLKTPLCRNCRLDILSIFAPAFLSPPPQLRTKRPPWQSDGAARRGSRAFATSRQRPGEAICAIDTQHAFFSEKLKPEDAARLARQRFRDRLPDGLLDDEQYSMYLRLYGEPEKQSSSHHVKGQTLDATDPDHAPTRLEQQSVEGVFEEIGVLKEDLEIPKDIEDLAEEGEDIVLHRTGPVPANARVQQDIEAALGKCNLDRMDEEEYEEEEDIDEGEEEETEDDAWLGGRGQKAHPLTQLGRFGTDPSTVFLPRSSFVDPIQDLLSTASNTHLKEIAHRELGGVGLPLSPSTRGRGVLPRHLPLGLQATTRELGQVEADVFLAAIMPPIYATAFGALTEVRKRLGPSWLQELFKREGGPRILEAGGAGAGIIACKQLLESEWAVLHGGKKEPPAMPTVVASTVVASHALRQRVSRFLENTNFLPRLPDYAHSTNATPPEAKQFDIVIAEHTIWPITEAHLRKAFISNLWSLTNPKGGVLVLLEKGWARGFEAIAAARQQLLEQQIPSEENKVSKNPASIIAPCTTHAKCPMYLIEGTTVGRKDSCRFVQRYIRPPFLQRLLGETARNDEDVEFSYVAIRKGRDHRQKLPSFLQGKSAAEAAFRGFADGQFSRTDGGDGSESIKLGPEEVTPASSLSFPRTILSPLKRRGHVILDLCTPAGKVERWIVPKSYSKAAYRDARKSRWGDLWALGAKTRIPRKVRLGRAKAREDDIEVKAGQPDGRIVSNSRIIRAQRKKKMIKRERRQPLREADV